MEIENSDKHFGYLYRYMQIQGLNLARALHRSGITEPKKIEDILKDYLSDMAYDFDEGTIKDMKLGADTVRPSVVFSNCPIHEAPSQIIAADGNDAFHETMPYGASDDIMDLLVKKIKLDFTYNDREL